MLGTAAAAPPWDDEEFFAYVARRIAPHVRAHLSSLELPIESVDVSRPDSPYVLLQHAKFALRNGPLTLREWTEAVRSQGFRHRWEPKRGRNQLPDSLSSLPSPSQHPEIFQALRVAGEPTRYKLRRRSRSS